MLVFAVEIWFSQVSTIRWNGDAKRPEKLPEFHFFILLDEAIICVA
jgi:hypothetical protein|tara:strand:+ start:2467 stop:2604 length:138 start_codon:yes stop_codon:yes gene_type:complete